MSGYHIRDIPRGTFGEASKVLEEAAEFGDAIEQNCRVMALVELADLVGATQAYLNNHHPGTDDRRPLHDGSAHGPCLQLREQDISQ
jgi:hypothetical protein